MPLQDEGLEDGEWRLPDSNRPVGQRAPYDEPPGRSLRYSSSSVRSSRERREVPKGIREYRNGRNDDRYRPLQREFVPSSRGRGGRMGMMKRHEPLRIGRAPMRPSRFAGPDRTPLSPRSRGFAPRRWREKPDVRDHGEDLGHRPTTLREKEDFRGRKLLRIATVRDSGQTSSPFYDKSYQEKMVSQFARNKDENLMDMRRKDTAEIREQCSPKRSPRRDTYAMETQEREREARPSGESAQGHVRSKELECSNREDIPLDTDQILEELRNLEDRRVDVENTLLDVDSTIERLRESEPRLEKALERVSTRPPAPLSPEFSAPELSEEVLSSESESDSSEVEEDYSETKRQKERRKLSGMNLKSRISSLPMYQRNLVSRLGALSLEKNDNRVKENLLLQGQEIARKVSAKFARLSPPSVDSSNGQGKSCKSRLEEVFKRLHEDTSQKLTDGVKLAIKRDFVSTLKQHLLAAIKYRYAFEKWQSAEIQQQQSANGAMEPTNPMRRTDSVNSWGRTQYGGDVEPMSPTLGRTSSRGGRNRGVVRSDLEERLAIATLQAVESIKSMTKLPTMILLTEHAIRWERMYFDKNRLIKNPVGVLELEQFSRVWSQKEKDIFAEKFLCYHKDFARISQYLPNRTVPEVVKHYYSIQRKEEFEKTRRKWQLRKRREKAEESAALQRYGNLSGHLSMVMPGDLQDSHDDRALSTGRTRSLGNDSDKEYNSSSGPTRSGPSRSSKSTKKRKKSRNSKQALLTYAANLHREFEPENPDLPFPNSRKPRTPRSRGSAPFWVVSTLVDGHKREDDIWAQTSRQLSQSSEGFDSANKTSRVEQNSDKNSDWEETGVEAVKPSRPKKTKSEQSKSVGRGRLPNAGTDKKYIEAVQIYGKDFQSIASYMNRTVDAAKKYWERHNLRLGLDKLLDGGIAPSTGTQDAPPSGQDTALKMSYWVPLLDLIPSAEAYQDLPSKSQEVSAVIAQAKECVQSIPTEQIESLLALASTRRSSLKSVGSLNVFHEIVSSLFQGADVAIEDLLGVLKGLSNYFESSEQKTSKGRSLVWSESDKRALIAAFRVHGRNWDRLLEAVPDKTITQIKAFYQNNKSKYFQSNESQSLSRKRKEVEAPDASSLDTKREKRANGNAAAPNVFPDAASSSWTHLLSAFQDPTVQYNMMLQLMTGSTHPMTDLQAPPFAPDGINDLAAPYPVGNFEMTQITESIDALAKTMQIPPAQLNTLVMMQAAAMAASSQQQPGNTSQFPSPEMLATWMQQFDGTQGEQPDINDDLMHTEDRNDE